MESYDGNVGFLINFPEIAAQGSTRDRVNPRPSRLMCRYTLTVGGTAASTTHSINNHLTNAPMPRRHLRRKRRDLSNASLVIARTASLQQPGAGRVCGGVTCLTARAPQHAHQLPPTI
jgi:hypothetical protein